MLFDGLTQAQMAVLDRTGIPYSAKIEVDKERYQVWLKMGANAASGPLSNKLAQRLGLPGPATGKFGLLAGFVHHQGLQERGRNRYVLAHEPAKANPQAAEKWDSMLKELDAYARGQARSAERGRQRGPSR